MTKIDFKALDLVGELNILSSNWNGSCYFDRRVSSPLASTGAGPKSSSYLSVPVLSMSKGELVLS